MNREIDNKAPYPGQPGYDPRLETVTDIISEISFLPQGELYLRSTYRESLRIDEALIIGIENGLRRDSSKLLKRKG